MGPTTISQDNNHLVITIRELLVLTVTPSSLQSTEIPGNQSSSWCLPNSPSLGAFAERAGNRANFPHPLIWYLKVVIFSMILIINLIKDPRRPRKAGRGGHRQWSGSGRSPNKTERLAFSFFRLSLKSRETKSWLDECLQVLKTDGTLVAVLGVMKH